MWIVFLLALVPRLVGIGQFLTADEKNWVGRGWEFVAAVREFRFNDTLQTTHPGIPTLWISGLTSAAVSAVRGVPFSFDDIRLFVVASQVPIVVLNSLLVAAIFWAARGLFPPSVAFLGALAIALDPFLIGHSKIVHVDGLLAGTTVLSLLLLLCAALPARSAERPGGPVRGVHSGLLAASAVVGGLATLSKLPALVLVPLVPLALFVSLRNGGHASEKLRSVVRPWAQWLTVALVTVLVLWPGLLWVPDPVGNVKTVKRDLLVAISTPHHMADTYTLNPWHYPAVLLARTTLPSLAGFVLFLFFFLKTTRARRVTPFWGPGEPRPSLRDQSLFALDLRTLWLLVAFIVLFVVGMTLGAKKGDRYILPVFPLIDLLAAVGLCSFLLWFRPWWPKLRVNVVAGVLLLAPLATELALLGPYALAHYNRLFPPNFSQELGWGEGLDQVATYLNSLDDRDTTAVASWYPEELRALVRRPVRTLGTHEQIRTGYVVLYRNMFGRPADHPANDFLDTYYRKREPVFTAFVNGLPYAWVYEKPVYDGVIGELLPDTTVAAEVPVSAGQVEGFELYLATYSGKANAGELVLRVRQSLEGPDLRVSRYRVRPEDDNVWVQFPFLPLAVDAGASPLAVLVSAEGTRAGTAPTIRVAARERDAPRFGVVRTPRNVPSVFATAARAGLLGVRPLRLEDAPGSCQAGREASCPS